MELQWSRRLQLGCHDKSSGHSQEKEREFLKFIIKLGKKASGTTVMLPVFG